MMQLKLMLLKRGLFIGSVFLFFITANAIGATNYVGRTYYVAPPPDGSDLNPGTQTQPWAHPQKCADTMVGGDTCIVADGTYDDKNGDKHVVNMRTFSGVGPTKWVTFRAENTGGAVIDGKNASVSGRGFLLTNSAFIKIIGFEIKRVYGGIKMQNSHDIYIEDCEIHEIGRHYSVDQKSSYPPCPTTASVARSYSGIGAKDTSYNITVRNCNLYNIGKAHVQPEGICWRDFLWDHAIYATGQGWLIENCKIWDIHSGWHLVADGHVGATKQPTHVIRNSEFIGGHGGSAYKRDVFKGQILLSKAHGDQSPEVVIENNYFFEPEQDMAIKVANYINLSTSIFRNNRTSAGTLYSGGRGLPSLSGNTLNTLTGSNFKISKPLTMSKVRGFIVGVIIDNGDPGTSFTGTWQVSGATNPWNPVKAAATSLYGRDGSTYTWHADLSESGTYEVYMWSTYHDSRSTSAPVTILHDGGSTTISVNQRANTGMWYRLGTAYYFDAATGGTVTLTASYSAPTNYCADAVKFVYVPPGGNIPPVAAN